MCSKAVSLRRGDRHRPKSYTAQLVKITSLFPPPPHFPGTDIVARVPPNVSFLIDDAESEWEWPEGTFDMVHIRYLNGGISDWGALFAEAYRHALLPTQAIINNPLLISEEH